jgi:hypothetical protein
MSEGSITDVGGCDVIGCAYAAEATSVADANNQLRDIIS